MHSLPETASMYSFTVTLQDGKEYLGEVPAFSFAEAEALVPKAKDVAVITWQSGAICDMCMKELEADNPALSDTWAEVID